MSPEAQLVLRDAPGKVAALDRACPTTIGRAEGNRLRLLSQNGVAEHHAVVRFSRSQGWLVCDWQSGDGTFLEGQRVRQCRRLSDGDEIQLGRQGPVLVFRMVAAPAGGVTAGAAPPQTATSAATATGARSASRATGAAGSPMGSGASRQNGGTGVVRPAPSPPQGTAAPQPPGSGPGAAAAGGAPLSLGGRTIPLQSIRSVQVRSRPRHPHSFSWWVLVCLGGMVLLPWPWLFWAIQISALAAWIVLGSRKDHELVLTLRDGMAHRHGFANRITALSHRNGIRKAIGQRLESG